MYVFFAAIMISMMLALHVPMHGPAEGCARLHAGTQPGADDLCWWWLTIVAEFVEDAQGIFERLASVAGAHQPAPCELARVQAGVGTHSCIHPVKYLCRC